MMSSSGGLLGGSRPASAVMYAARSSLAGVSAAGSISFGDAEHAQMLTALRQPLFIQTPLQAMLENMVEKLQTQATVITTLQEKVASLERTNLDSRELLQRVRLVEERVATVTAGNLSPFNQAELLQRVNALETRAGRIEDAAKQAKFEAQQDAVQPRLAMCEQRLAGVHNLAGHLMAVHAVAEELGIVIPQPQLSNIMQLGGMQAVAGQATMGLAVVGQAAKPAAANAQAQAGAYDLCSDTAASGTAAAAVAAAAAAGSPYNSNSNATLALNRELSSPGKPASSSSSSSSSNCAVPSAIRGNESTVASSYLLGSRDGASSLYYDSTLGTAASPRNRSHTTNVSAEGNGGRNGTSLQAHSRSTNSAAGGGLRPATADCPSGTEANQGVAAAGADAAVVPTLNVAEQVGVSVAVPAGTLTRSRQQELQQQIDAGKQEAANLQQQLDDVQQQVEQLRAAAASSQDQALSMLANLADQLQALADRFDASLRRREVVQATQQAAQVSASDFTALQSKVEAAAAATAAADKELQSIKSKDLPALCAAVADFAKKLGAGPRAAVSEVDKLLASQLGVLQDQVSGLTLRLEAREAAELAGQGVATQENLQELSRLMTSKASKDDMRAVLARAVDLALEAHRNAMGDREASGASRTRCLVCERTLLDHSSSPPRTAPTGSSSLPLFEPFRPRTAAVHSGSSSSSTNASGRVHGQQGGGQAAAKSQLNSSSVTGPASDNYLGPGSAGQALGVGPLGPGLNAAQLRRMAAERVHGSSSSSCNAPGAAAASAAEWTPNGGGGTSGELCEGVGSVSARSVTPGPSSSVMYSSPGPYSASQQQQQGKGWAPSSGVGLDGRPQTTGGMMQAGRGGKLGAAAAAAAAGIRGSSGGMRGHKPQGKRTPVFV